MSIESDEGDVEDNRAGSITSSRSNMSEVCIFQLFQIISDVFGFTDYITSLRVTPCSKRRRKYCNCTIITLKSKFFFLLEISLFS